MEPLELLRLQPSELFASGSVMCVAVNLGVKMADTLSFTAKVDMVDF